MKLEDFRFVDSQTEARIGGDGPEIILPTTIKGDLARVLYEKYLEEKAKYFQDHSLIMDLTQEEEPELIGSTTICALLFDQVLRPYGVRTASLKNFRSHLLLNKLKEGGFHTYTRDIIYWSLQDSENEHNYSMASQLEPHVNRTPSILMGLDVSPKDDEGYGVTLTPNDDFDVRYAEVFLPQNEGQTFSEVDLNGYPVFVPNGNRYFATRSEGISGITIGSDLSITPNYEHNCADKCLSARLILVMDEKLRF